MATEVSYVTGRILVGFLVIIKFVTNDVFINE